MDVEGGGRPTHPSLITLKGIPPLINLNLENLGCFFQQLYHFFIILFNGQHQGGAAPVRCRTYCLDVRSNLDEINRQMECVGRNSAMQRRPSIIISTIYLKEQKYLNIWLLGGGFR
mgnify:CR=1 FL=1